MFTYLTKLAKNLASKTSTIQKPHSVSFSLIGFKTGITVWFYFEASFCPASFMSLSPCKHFKKELFWSKNGIMKGRQKGIIYGAKRETF